MLSRCLPWKLLSRLQICQRQGSRHANVCRLFLYGRPLSIFWHNFWYSTCNQEASCLALFLFVQICRVLGRLLLNGPKQEVDEAPRIAGNSIIRSFAVSCYSSRPLFVLCQSNYFSTGCDQELCKVMGSSSALMNVSIIGSPPLSCSMNMVFAPGTGA